MGLGDIWDTVKLEVEKAKVNETYAATVQLAWC